MSCALPPAPDSAVVTRPSSPGIAWSVEAVSSGLVACPSRGLREADMPALNTSFALCVLML